MMDAIFPVMLEAALRALVAAFVVWSALRLLRVCNVRIQKAAWTLMLLGALAMPLLMRWLPAADGIQISLPSRVFAAVDAEVRAVVLPARRIDANLANAAAWLDRPPAPPSLAWSLPANQENNIVGATPETAGPAAIAMRGPSALLPTEAAPARNPHDLVAPLQAAVVPASSRSLHLLDIAWMMYLAVAAALLLRLIGGAISALQLWKTAEPVDTPKMRGLLPGAVVRSSPRVSSPANIGSGIVLPADYHAWGNERLRVVLAHERAHVRYCDFYLQLLAGLYAALVWFSPLGWWLKRKLSDLSEAMGDRAGLQEAASPSSYAQMLLEFAALPRPIRTGVAMARTRHLTTRIERLLDQTKFQNAFADRGRRPAVLAMIAVISVLAASAATVRVQAAGQTPGAAQPPSQAQTISAAQESGVSNPPQETVTDQDQQQPAPAPAPSTPAAAPNPAPAPAPGVHAPAPAPAPGAARAPVAAAPAAPVPGQVVGLPASPDPFQIHPLPPVHVQIPPMPPMPDINAELEARVAEFDAMRNQPFLFRYGPFMAYDGGDPWALVPAQGEPVVNTPFYGTMKASDRNEIDNARKTAHAPFFWFKHDGKSYVVDDASVVAQIESLEKPVEDLRSQMRAIGKQQREVGQQLRQKAREQKQIMLPKPDLSKQMADLNAVLDNLKSSQGDTITQAQYMKLQLQVNELQGQLARTESGFYRDNGQWAAEMGAFGKQMSRLGAEQGRLAGETIRLSTANRSKIDAIIQQSLRDGKAKPAN
jgi:beta-lactamase regulating signal transducer with metallopeptidase domain